MAAVGTYNLRTLNGNWFEDRQQPGNAHTALANIDKKLTRPYETDIAYIGERYDVLSRIARMPNRESYATPDDGFREKDCTSKVDFAPPRSRTDFVFKAPAKPRLISSESVPEVSFEERRPIPGTKRGFGSVLNRHEENHEQRFWNTTTGDVYGEGGPRIPTGRRTDPLLFRRGAGTDTEHDEMKTEGIAVGCLTGEHFCESPDPACNTKTQRAWLYQADPALKNVHLGGTRPKIREHDNELSLPIGRGAMAKVRSDLAERKGRLYRTATCITKGLGQRPGVHIFQDG